MSYYALHGKLDEIKSELQEAIFKKLDVLAKEIKKPLKEGLNKKFEILEKNNTTYLAELKDALNKKGINKKVCSTTTAVLVRSGKAGRINFVLFCPKSNEIFVISIKMMRIKVKD